MSDGAETYTDIQNFVQGARESESAAPGASAAPGDLYTDEEVSEIVARLSSFGLPLPLHDPYIATYIARTKPAMELLGMGEALGEFGITKSGSQEAMPAWVRAGGGLAVLGVSAVMIRRELAKTYFVDTSGAAAAEGPNSDA